MFNAFTAVNNSRMILSLPPLAARHTLEQRKPTIATLTSYANSLIFEYPEEYDLINDFVAAGLGLNLDLYNDRSLKELQDQLIDLERYLLDTKY